jgi:alkylhydroperoxidase/carboxymuconolactone decarboxylase family protein YurZ
MATDMVRVPTVRLGEANAAVGAAYKELRVALAAAGPLDHTTCELILLSAFAAAGRENSVKIHALRGFAAGMSKAAMQQAVMIPLGAAATLPAIADALRWIDEAQAEFAAAS